MSALPTEYSALPAERLPAPRGRRRHARLAAAPDAGASLTPQAVSFAGVGVPAPLVTALTAAGITAPFPIQAAKPELLLL